VTSRSESPASILELMNLARIVDQIATLGRD
jgi:hypothetical protein